MQEPCVVSVGSKNEWGKSQERFRAFWQRELVDRCCIAIRARRKGAPPAPVVPAPTTHEGLVRAWVDPEANLKQMLAGMERTFHGGEAYPATTMCLGASVMAAFYGARVEFRPETVWFHPAIRDIRRCRWDPPIEAAPLYRETFDATRYYASEFVAAKNVEYPDEREIEGLERYITRFVWGGLQRTDQESHPYGIYGIHDWRSNRESADDGPAGKLHLWRIYDYPHIILLYLSMYRIARDCPDLCKALTAEEYLRRAYGTALAYFTYPLQIRNWSPHKTGTHNELVIEELIEELDAAGRPDQARELRKHWETKVRQFVSGQTNLFGSEYPFDTTGFESTHAFARYALRHLAESDLGVSREEAMAFLRRQVQLNDGCRGWLETAYCLYGSDIRGCGNAHYTLIHCAGPWRSASKGGFFSFRLKVDERTHRVLPPTERERGIHIGCPHGGSIGVPQRIMLEAPRGPHLTDGAPLSSYPGHREAV